MPVQTSARPMRGRVQQPTSRPGPTPRSSTKDRRSSRVGRFVNGPAGPARLHSAHMRGPRARQPWPRGHGERPRHGSPEASPRGGSPPRPPPGRRGDAHPPGVSRNVMAMAARYQVVSPGLPGTVLATWPAVLHRDASRLFTPALNRVHRARQDATRVKRGPQPGHCVGEAGALTTYRRSPRFEPWAGRRGHSHPACRPPIRRRSECDLVDRHTPPAASILPARGATSDRPTEVGTCVRQRAQP
jgi:hypothetical protein